MIKMDKKEQILQEVTRREPRCCLITSLSELERRLPLSQPICLSPDGRKY
jgi:hypothetical protein